MDKANVIKKCWEEIVCRGRTRFGKSLLFKRQMTQLHVNGFVATKTKGGLSFSSPDQGSCLFAGVNINDPFYDQFLVPWVDPDFSETKLLGTEPGDILIKVKTNNK